MTNFEKMVLEVVNKEYVAKDEMFAFFCDRYNEMNYCSNECPVKKVFPECRDLPEAEWDKVKEFFISKSS